MNKELLSSSHDFRSLTISIVTNHIPVRKLYQVRRHISLTSRTVQDQFNNKHAVRSDKQANSMPQCKLCLYQ
jgi:hypothetical protein